MKKTAETGGSTGGEMEILGRLKARNGPRPEQLRERRGPAKKGVHLVGEL